ncbi:MAG: protein kinase [Archangium sp.]|nr:protein kinase [Archangium sp.]
MSCPPVLELDAFASGSLDTIRAEVVDAHVATCERCKTRLVQFSKTLGALVDATAATPIPLEESHYVPVLNDGGEQIELGRGGIGRVLLMGDTHLGRDVAMKVLLARGTKAPEEQRGIELRFVREARVTGQLEHPAIVPVYELGRRPDGNLYYVMRRVSGRTLDAALEEAADLQARLAFMPHVLAACQAIAYAHSRHVVHRDLKPQNVMLGKFGETHVVDWGLAAVRGSDQAPSLSKASDSGTVRLAPKLTSGAEMVMGTPAYMSPEQARGQIALVDELSDVWGLGTILYEVLTGVPPRNSLDRFNVKPVLEVEPNAPRELAAICTKALEEVRQKRYQSAEAVVNDVAAYVHGRRVEAYSYRAIDLLRRFAWQYRAPLFVGLAALITIITMSVISVRRVRAERDEARQLAQLVFGDLGKHLSPQPGVSPVVDAVTQRALTFYEGTLDEQDVPTAEREEIAGAIVRLLQLNISLGKYTEAARLKKACDRLTSPLSKERGVTLLATSVNCQTGAASAALQQNLLAEAEAELKEADRRFALGPAEWTDPSWKAAQSGVLSRWFSLEYARGDLERAKSYAEQEVALDEKLLQATQSGERRQSLSASLRDLALVELAQGDIAQSLTAGDRAITVLRSDAAPSRHELTMLASAQTQQANTLRMSPVKEDRERAPKLEREAVDSYERVLKEDPGLVEVRADYGLLLVRMGEGQRALEQLQRAEATGATLAPETYVMAALLAGRTELVVARKDQLIAAGQHRGLWVLALALASRGDNAGAAEAARLAVKDEQPFVEWPSAGIHAFAKKVGGKNGAAIEKFATDYDATLDAGKDEWAPVFERFAADLERK